jgi:hypothetical protein
MRVRTLFGLSLVTTVGLSACGAPDSSSPLRRDESTSIPSSPPAPPEAARQPDPAGPTETAGSPESTEAEEDRDPATVAVGVAVTDVAVFQAVKVPVVKNGSLVRPSSRNGPVVAGRAAMLRVYVRPESNAAPRDITAVLRFANGDETSAAFRITRRIGKASSDEDGATTFDFSVPASALRETTSFRVWLTEPSGASITESTVTEARFPRDGSFASLGASPSGKVRVTVVPIRYDADSSHRTPDVSPEQLENYRKELMRLYPASDVVLTAHEPYAFTSQISPNGNGFQSVLRAMMQLRQDEQPESDVYYYGLLAPRASLAAWCQGGCVTGLSSIVDDPASEGLRASVGIGFADDESRTTMAHELGHAHGREHAPCGGPQGVDPTFPYSSGAIGVWGYDIFSHSMIAPTKGKDMMGYCPNKWVSDYTFRALFDRIVDVHVEKSRVATLPAPIVPRTSRTTFRVAVAGASNELRWDGELDLDPNALGGAVHDATFLQEDGTTLATSHARFIRFDHLPGGFVLLPKDSAIDARGWTKVTVDDLFATAPWRNASP